ncbi:DUF5719 family protein [Rarobacter incanus]|uniref:Uncharacterized protein n=1 Tax=Rarobacter incanus TaxID=153494 RepID=A0A542SNM3_9MICO|nr:DUF5719 family protein [Rarobacter incanus]TQK76220.1 hypothetical protein FB389_0880 [Rarobacter incanus]
MTSLKSVAAGIGLLALAGVAAVIPYVEQATGHAWDGKTELGTTSVEVTPSDRVITCPGPVPEVTGTSDADGEQGESHPVSSWVVAESTPGAVTTLAPLADRGQDGADTATNPAVTGKAPIAVASQLAASSPLVAMTAIGSASDKAAGAPSARPAAATASWANSGDQRGLVAANCRYSSDEHWIVAGDTEPGTTSNLVIDNPGLTSVTVNVELWGSSGPIALSGPSAFAVAPGASQTMLLAAVAPGERRIVAHVTTDGGYVDASISQTTLDGLVPLGIDTALSGATPSRVQVLSGVRVDDSEIGSARAATLRLLAPNADTHVKISLLTAQGLRILRGAQEATLTAGEVTDISLGGLAQGLYSVVIVADRQVVAGAKSVVKGPQVTSGEGSLQVDIGTSGDFAWVGSTPATGTAAVSQVLAIPPGLTGDLVLTRVNANADAAASSISKLPIVGDDDAKTGAQGVERRDVEIQAYDAGGAALGKTAAKLGYGGIVTVSMSSLGSGGQIAAIRVTSPAIAASAGDEVFAISGVVAAADTQGTIASMQASATPDTETSIAVTRGTLG